MAAEKHSIAARLKNTMKFAFIGAMLMLMFNAAQAQSTDGSSAVSMDQYKLLQKKRGERASLQRILNAMNVVDSIYIVHYPTWVIRDEDIRQRTYKMFRNRLKFPSRDSDLVVVTTPERDDIVRMTMGSVSMGREEVRMYMGDNLRITILEKDYLRTELEPEIGRRHKRVVEDQASNILFEGSLFGARLLFPSGWGAMVKIGNDDLGFPFWSSGSMEMFLTLDRLAIGATLPINSGLTGADVIGPISVQSRKLNGAPGFALQYSQPIGAGVFNIHFQSSNLNGTDSSSRFTDPSHFYYVRSMIQGYFQQRVAVVNNEHFFTVGLGMGYHQIGLGAVDSNYTLSTTDKLNYISPLLRIQYERNGSKTYGVGIQVYASNMTVNAWLEFIKDFIYADIKYSTPVIRGAKPWENPYFVMFSPRIKLAF